ncbi:hypothetical protein, partial [Enterococcus sp. HMSC072H05]|uniref:hypothetical protein n=1 Tax=Enterococcus sp. HMSC072H05 TaxID=1715012 RepID=UPI000AD617D7
NPQANRQVIAVVAQLARVKVPAQVRQSVIQTQSAPALVTVKVQVSVIRSACQLANRFQPAQVNLQASRQATAAAVQSVQAKVQVQAHQPVIQDQTASV